MQLAPVLQGRHKPQTEHTSYTLHCMLYTNPCQSPKQPPGLNKHTPSKGHHTRVCRFLRAADPSAMPSKGFYTLQVGTAQTEAEAIGKFLQAAAC